MFDLTVSFDSTVLFDPTAPFDSAQGAVGSLTKGEVDGLLSGAVW